MAAATKVKFSIFMAEQYPTVYKYHIFSIHSCTDRHLGGFYALPIVVTAAVNVGVQISLQDSDFVSSDTMQKGDG